MAYLHLSAKHFYLLFTLSLPSKSYSFFDENTQNHGKYRHATHYTYDLLGNVHTLIQDYPNTPLGDKITKYAFDLQSGEVNEVQYQADSVDQFTHRYVYDPLNRLVRVETSPNGVIWETDAEYFYYRHGSLARTELGSDKVQGQDYIYTLQGFIKKCKRQFGRCKRRFRFRRQLGRLRPCAARHDKGRNNLRLFAE